MDDRYGLGWPQDPEPEATGMTIDELFEDATDRLVDAVELTSSVLEEWLEAWRSPPPTYDAAAPAQAREEGS